MPCDVQVCAIPVAFLRAPTDNAVFLWSLLNFYTARFLGFWQANSLIYFGTNLCKIPSWDVLRFSSCRNCAKWSRCKVLCKFLLCPYLWCRKRFGEEFHRINRFSHYRSYKVYSYSSYLRNTECDVLINFRNKDIGTSTDLVSSLRISGDTVIDIVPIKCHCMANKHHTCVCRGLLCLLALSLVD